MQCSFRTLLDPQKKMVHGTRKLKQDGQRRLSSFHKVAVVIYKESLRKPKIQFQKWRHLWSKLTSTFAIDSPSWKLKQIYSKHKSYTRIQKSYARNAVHAWDDDGDGFGSDFDFGCGGLFRRRRRRHIESSKRV